MDFCYGHNLSVIRITPEAVYIESLTCAVTSRSSVPCHLQCTNNEYAFHHHNVVYMRHARVLLWTFSYLMQFQSNTHRTSEALRKTNFWWCRGIKKIQVIDLSRTYDSKALNYVTMMFSSLCSFTNVISRAWHISFCFRHSNSFSELHLVFDVTSQQEYIVHSDICITHLMSM